MRSRLTLIGFALLLTACAAPYKTGFDYDPQARFGGYRTWGWMGKNPMIVAAGAQGTAVGNPMWQNRIMSHVEQAMASKGFRLVKNPNTADFVVSFTLGTRDKITVHSYPAAYHGSWGRGWGYGHHGYRGTEVDVRQYTEGQLAIDVFDVRSRRPVWHGFASGNVRKNRDHAEREALLKEVVASILDTFPPA